MNSHIAGVIAISLSFSSLATERQSDLLHTAPTATRSTMLICKAERISDGVATTLAGRAYLEGVGEQILLALIPTTQSGEHLHVSFNAWGFTPFGQVESHEQFTNWTLIHVGRDNLDNGDAFDYTFVDYTSQAGHEIRSRPFMRIYECQRQNKRPEWTRKKSTQKYFSGELY